MSFRITYCEGQIIPTKTYSLKMCGRQKLKHVQKLRQAAILLIYCSAV
jgi:hypothetical protein